MNYGVVIGNEPYLGDDSPSLVEHAVLAEEAGWDGVFLGDHLCPHALSGDGYQSAFDPWITLAGIATRTESVTLGTWISPVPRRQPWQLARDLATLDHLSDGRVLLCAGLGTEADYATFGQPWEPRALGQRYDEALEVITGLWNGEPFSYDGDHFSIEDAVLHPTPVQRPRIPIVAGCWWPNRKPFHRGARWDGIAPNWSSLFGRAPPGSDEPRPPEEEARELLEYYHGVTDDPGEIVLPIDPVGASPEYVETCRKLGATWLLTTHIGSIYFDADAEGEYSDGDPDPEGEYSVEERIRQGPPDDSYAR